MTNLLLERTPMPDRTFPMNTFHTPSIAPHWHYHMEWVYVLRGSARFQLDGDFIDMLEGELMFIHSKQVHSASPLTKDTELIAIVFNDALLRTGGLDCTDNKYFAPLLDNRMPMPNFIKTDDPLWNDIRTSLVHIVNEFELNQLGFELFVKAEFYKLFGLIFRNFEPYIHERKRSRHESTHFTPLLAHLREHFAEPISIRQAAQMVNMSPNYFCKVFKKLTGKTLVEYLHSLRVMEAERLLLETDLPITTIACEVGFNNITYFGRIFKKYKNRVPSDIRKDNPKPFNALFL